jgi:hypothetical protein
MTSTKKSRLALSACLMFGLAACQTAPYVPTLYDANTANVKTMAISDDALPEEMGANELASAAGTGQAAGGLIGLLVVAAIEGAETSSRKGKLNEMMAPLNFDPEAEFETMLKAKLMDAGYEGLDVVEVNRGKKSALAELPETDADAVLNVEMTSFGVQKAVTGEEWRPAAGVKIQLVRNETSEVLMENMISYNSGILGVPQTEGFITMEPSGESIGYMKIKEMEPEVVRDETLKMLDEISSMIVTLL